MKNIIKVLVLFFLLTILAGTYAHSQINAQEETTLKLYVSDTCPYCTALLEDLESEGLTNQVTILEVSTEPNLSEFRSVINECGVRNAVPLLYDEEECFQGQYQALERVYTAAGLSYETQSDSQSTDNDELVEDQTEIEGDLSTQSDLNDDEDKGDSDSTNLADKLEIKEERFTPPEIPAWNIVVMLIAPICFIGLSYYIIKKMKV